jgi:Sec-independent protein translocase protein TatA
MFDLSAEKIVVVLVVALVVLGPGRLAEAARALGRARAQLRQLTSGLPPETANLVRNPRQAIFDALDEPRQAMADTAAAARESMVPTGPTTDKDRGGGTA